jgi:predicted Fe-Mo cluster-binding NifX family protein
MLVCLPTQGNTGAADTICDHFGSAPYFTLYDSESEEITIVENRNAHHGHGSCHPLSQLKPYKIDGVVCQGMGRRAIDFLQEAQIKVYSAGSVEVAAVLEKVKSDDLVEIDPAQACRGHGHQGGRGHGTRQGRTIRQGKLTE